MLCAQPLSIARFWGNRHAAVSYTFDDGLQDQYTLAFQELRHRGLKATFAIIGSKVGGVMHSSQDQAMGISGTPCMTWDMLREMAADGQEISSHGWEHKKVTRLTREQLRYEVQHNDSIIYEQTGCFPRTYFFPGNSRDSATLAFCGQDRVGCRTFQIAIGARRDSTWLNSWVDTLIQQGQWGVGMTHGIAMGYDHFADPQTLWSHLDYVCTRQDLVWVATFHDAAAYIKERDNTQLNVKQTRHGFEIKPSCSLSPDIFCQPLTLLLDGLDVSTARQGRKPLEIYNNNGHTMLDFDPHGGKIILKNR